MTEEQDKLVTDNIKLAYFVANKFRNNRYIQDKEELISLAHLGLVKASKTYDTTKKVKFSTYATTCCINEISCAIRFISKPKRYTESLAYLNEPLPKSMDSRFNDVELLDTLENKDNNKDKINKEINYYFEQLKQKVSKKEYKIFFEYTVEGKTRKQLAEELNMNSRTVYYYIDKCRKYLIEIRKREDRAVA